MAKNQQETTSEAEKRRAAAAAICKQIEASGSFPYTSLYWRLLGESLR